MPEKDRGVNVAARGRGQESGRESAAAAVLVYATFPSEGEASRIGAELVEMRLAACVNILSGMLSIYRWEGAIHRDREVVAIIKTRDVLVERVIGVVRVRHSYVNPALVVLPVVGGSADFLEWIVAETH